VFVEIVIHSLDAIGIESIKLKPQQIVNDFTGHVMLCSDKSII